MINATVWLRDGDNPYSWVRRSLSPATRPQRRETDPARGPAQGRWPVHPGAPEGTWSTSMSPTVVADYDHRVAGTPRVLGRSDDMPRDLREGGRGDCRRDNELEFTVKVAEVKEATRQCGAAAYRLSRVWQIIGDTYLDGELLRPGIDDKAAQARSDYDQAVVELETRRAELEALLLRAAG
jgi:hypothetical protein